MQNVDSVRFSHLWDISERKCPVQICMQIGLKMEAGDCPTLNMDAKENYLLSQSLIHEQLPWVNQWT